MNDSTEISTVQLQAISDNLNDLEEKAADLKNLLYELRRKREPLSRGSGDSIGNKRTE